MRRALLLLLLAACGGDGAARFEVRVQALLPSDVSELQLSVLTERGSVDCAAVTLGCVKGQFATTRFADLTDSRGRTAKAVRFSRDGGVEVSLAPGKDFAFVIEALTTGDPPQLAGSSCTYVENLSAGANRVSTNPITLRADAGVVSSCDPRP